MRDEPVPYRTRDAKGHFVPKPPAPVGSVDLLRYVVVLLEELCYQGSGRRLDKAAYLAQLKGHDDAL